MAAATATTPCRVARKAGRSILGQHVAHELLLPQHIDALAAEDSINDINRIIIPIDGVAHILGQICPLDINVLGQILIRVFGNIRQHG
jgi:hypothetical protein